MSYLVPSFSTGLGGRGAVEPFPDPFLDYASTAMPSALEDVFRYCEFIMLSQGVYRAAVERVVSYFITDINISGTDRESKEKYLEFLGNRVGIHALLRTIAMDYITYGNFFVSVIAPFRRSLHCKGKNCSFEAPIARLYDSDKCNFHYKDGKFTATCPMCGYGGEFDRRDRRSADEEDIVVKRWSPHEIELLWDPYTDQVGHIWKIPTHYKQTINKGTLFHLERAPWEVLQAIHNNRHIQFNKDVMYHGKEQCLAGVLNKGWGVSRVLTNFRQAWYVQVLHRYNEAIGLDYIIPFRVITPEPRPSAGEMGDPLFSHDLGGFTGAVQGMLRQRRRDPTSWFTLPYPIRYQALGAEASQLAPYQLIDQALDTLLNSVGVPVDFYKASLGIQAAPVALRLMESNWSHLTRMLNNFLQWLCNKISTIRRWDEISVSLERPSHADDLNRQLAKLQLMLGQQVSQTTGLKSVGLVFEDEQKRMLEEQKFVAEETQKAQEEMDAAGLGDQMAQGAAGGATPGQIGAMGGPIPSGSVPRPAGGQAGPQQMPMDPVQAVMAQLPGADQQLSPPELEQIANTIAQQVYAMPTTMRISALRQLKGRNMTIHSLVKSLLDGMDSQAEARGRQMQQQQAQATQQQSMAPPPPMGQM